MTCIEDRKKVGHILRQVRLGTLCVREALLKFPKDNEDKNVQACYHALVHYEADEDLRLRDSLYKEEQDDYIEFLSDKMIAGDDLPQNIITSYDEYYASANIPHSDNSRGFIKSFFRFLNI